MGIKETKDNDGTVGKVDKIIKWLSVITGLVAILKITQDAILYYFNYDYSRKAEIFYGIPHSYFIDSIIDDKIMDFAYMGACLLVFGSPIIVKKLFKVNRFSVVESFLYSLYSLCITLFMFYIVLWSNIKIISIFNWKVKGSVLLIGTVLMAILIFASYMFLFMKDSTRIRKDKPTEKENSIKEEKTKEVNDKKKKKEKSTAKETIKK